MSYYYYFFTIYSAEQTPFLNCENILGHAQMTKNF